MKTLLFSILLLCNTAFAGIQENKKIVLDFYDLAFNQHKPTEAALKFLSEEYIQHNPYVATGRKAFIDAFAEENDTTSFNIFKRTIAEGDIVILHSHKKSGPNDLGVAGIDMFRIKGGKIVEHWDVNQKIPVNAKNDMF